MPKVGYYQYIIERFFAQIQLNIQPETKPDCEMEKHLSVSEKLAICNCYKEFAALHF
jgi:hypothetical protein